jgi:hypothetical protein
MAQILPINLKAWMRYSCFSGRDLGLNLKYYGTSKKKGKTRGLQITI